MIRNYFGLSEETYKKIRFIVEKYPQYTFKVFGSRARGDYKQSSDIDIAIIGNIEENDRFLILNDIDLLDIPYAVDIVFVCNLKKVELLDSINKEGVDF